MIAARTRSLLLTSGAVAGGLVLLALTAGLLLGLRPVVITSGSMAPTLPVGALAVDRSTPAGAVRVGDVVTVPTAAGASVTHRVVGVERAGGEVVLTLRGDANQSSDRETHRLAVGHRVGRLVGHVPWVGRVLALLHSPAGYLALGGLAVVVLRVLVGGSGSPPSRPGPPRHRGRRRALVAAGAVAPLAITAPSGATWYDDVPVTGATLTSYLVPKPANIQCTVTGGTLVQKTATIVWDEVSSPYPLDYTATIVETGQSLVVVDNGSTRQTQFSAGLLSTVLNQTYSIKITAALPSPGASWAKTSTQPVTIALLGLGLTCGTPS